MELFFMIEIAPPEPHFFQPALLSNRVFRLTSAKYFKYYFKLTFSVMCNFFYCEITLKMWSLDIDVSPLARLAWKLNPKITRQAMARGLNNLLLDTTLAPAEGMGTFLTSYPPPV